MKLLRILIITHAPLSSTFGAGQMAINLGEAFKKQGHDVTIWSPYPLESCKRSWQKISQIRNKLDKFITKEKQFDLIDAPAMLITQKVSNKSDLLVARSVQPDILYLMDSLKVKEKSFRDVFKLPISYFYFIFRVNLVIQGWRRANYILCLGRWELYWMKKCFFWWQNKLISYVNALAQLDSENLKKVRQQKQKQKVSKDKLKFLWIGRWASHKGINTLLNFIDKWLSDRPQDTFTIAGCGTEAVKNFPSKLLDSKSVKIIPSFERSSLYSLLINNDIGLFTSKVEGWGLVLNEMIESGMPVFATYAGGVYDLERFVSNKLQLFPPTLQSIHDAINSSVNLDDYYKTFTWEKIARDYVNSIFTEVNFTTK